MLSPEEQELFKKLSREALPPSALENRIIHELAQEGLIKKKTGTLLLKWSGAVAASALLFLSGALYERTQLKDAVAIEPSKGYMLILHEDQDFKPGDPMEMFKEYEKWMNDTYRRGVRITGQELKDESVLVQNEKPEDYRNGIAEPKTTGYFLLEAGSLDEAVSVARENPHTRHGGTIEVKQFMVR